MTTPLNNKKGTTLVELMVCLVLLALFGTAAVTLVKPCAEAYIEVQQLTRAQNLCRAEPLPAHAFLQANGGQGRKEKRVHDLRLYNGLS